MEVRSNPEATLAVELMIAANSPPAEKSEYQPNRRGRLAAKAAQRAAKRAKARQEAKAATKRHKKQQPAATAA